MKLEMKVSPALSSRKLAIGVAIFSNYKVLRER